MPEYRENSPPEQEAAGSNPAGRTTKSLLNQRKRSLIIRGRFFFLRVPCRVDVSAG